MRALQTLLGKLSVRNKFLLMGLLGLIAIGVPTWQTMTQLRTQITLAENELSGAPAAVAVQDVLLELRESRAFNALVGVGVDRSADRDAAVANTDAAIVALEAALDGRSQFADTTARLAEAKESWAALRPRVLAGEIAATENMAAFYDAIHDFDIVLDRIRDESSYSYTPFVDSYHLMFAGLTVGPAVDDAVSEVLSIGIVLASQEQPSENLRGALSAWRTASRTTSSNTTAS